MIYFLQSGPLGPIKIGYTKAHVGSRIISLQMASPYELRFLGAHDGDRETEASLHRKFADSQFRGEWFHPVKSLLEYIETSADETSLDRLLRNDLKAIIKDRRNWSLEQRAAYKDKFEGFGNPYTYQVARWRSGMSAPTPAIERELVEFLSEHGLLPGAAA